LTETFHPNALDGHIGMVTGGASGIGKATALALADLGATIAVADQNSEGAALTAVQIRDRGGHAEPITLDLAQPSLLSGLVERMQTELGPIDLLVNCAGIVGRKMMDTTLDDWNSVLTVNLAGPFILMQAVARQMIDNERQGCIVNVTSSSAFRAVANNGAYGASKAGLASLTRSAAWELGPYGIRVNAVAPGVTRTPMALAGKGPHDLEDLVSTGHLANLLQRVSEPEDLASVIAFLCLPGSRQITAQVIQVSAGAVVCSG
jgi:NAD(P)-dependent dehydrogenase (short-subunit alcohol dehydrogenase family)